MQEEIRALATERDAVILAHNYQVPEVQDVADFVGDSLGLSHEAARTEAEAIAFCGVHFMAETAAILCPEKTVLIPDLDAGCSLAASITAEQLRAWKAENPGAVVVSYVNTTAEVKAETDYCCTSGNAKAIIDSIPEDTEILFCPTCSSALAREGHRAQAPDLDGRVPRPRGHPPARHRRAGRPKRPTPSSSSTPSAAARASAWPSGTSKTHILSTEGMIKLREVVAEGAVPGRDRDRDHPPPEQGGAGEALRGRLREGDLPLHEDDHAAEAARLAARLEVRRDGAGRDRRTRAGAIDRMVAIT